MTHALLVLLVADVSDERYLYVEQLRAAGYDCVHTQTASDGSRLAREARPVLIVTDMMLHGGSALDLIEQLKADPRTSAIPVIMLAARAYESDRVEAARAGVDLFLDKPCPPVHLAAEVRNLLSRTHDVAHERAAQRRRRVVTAALAVKPAAARRRAGSTRKKG